MPNDGGNLEGILAVTGFSHHLDYQQFCFQRDNSDILMYPHFHGFYPTYSPHFLHTLNIPIIICWTNSCPWHSLDLWEMVWGKEVKRITKMYNKMAPRPSLQRRDWKMTLRYVTLRERFPEIDFQRVFFWNILLCIIFIIFHHISSSSFCRYFPCFFLGMMLPLD